MDEIDRIVEQWQRERPDLDVSPTHTLQRITRLSLLQAGSFARVFAPYGISFGEYLVLAALRRAGPPYRMSPTRLFNAVILSSGAMTNRVRKDFRSGIRSGVNGTPTFFVNGRRFTGDWADPVAFAAALHEAARAGAHTAQ